jgi:hypothetical protein
MKYQKSFFLTLILSAVVGPLFAQEQLSREEALKYAFAVTVNLDQLQGTPIPTDVDVKRPIVLRDGEYGGMYLPESKLTLETIAKAGEKAVSIGQLWLHKLAPVRDSETIGNEKLRIAKVTDTEGSQLEVPQCTLGVRRNASGALELLLFGKGTDPIVTAPLASVGDKTGPAVALEAERNDNGGLLTITMFGKYKAQLSFTGTED